MFVFSHICYKSINAKAEVNTIYKKLGVGIEMNV